MGFFTRVKSFFAPKPSVKQIGAPIVTQQEAKTIQDTSRVQVVQTEGQKTTSPLPSADIQKVIRSSGGAAAPTPSAVPTAADSVIVPTIEAKPKTIVQKLQQQEQTIQEASRRPVSIITEAKDPTVKEALGRIKTIQEQEGIVKAASKAPKLFLGAITKPAEREKLKQERFSERVDVLKRGGLEISPEERRLAGLGLAQGTAQTLTRTPVNKQNLLRDFRLGDRPSGVAFTELEAERIQGNAQREGTRLLSRDTNKQKVNDTKIQNKINRGEITLAEGQKESEVFASNLDIAREKELEAIIKPQVESTQKIIDSAAIRGDISRIVVGTVTAFVVGAGVGSLLSAAPSALQKGVAIAGGGLFVKESSQLAQRVGTGEAGAVEVVGFGLQTGAFIAGAKVGSAKRTPTSQTKLEVAIQRSQLEIKSKGIINKDQLSVLDIPSTNRVQLKARLTVGGSLRKLEVNLKPRSTTDQTLINKELPFRKIEFIEVTDRTGRVIERVALGKVTIEGKTGKTFKQDIISASEGFVTPKGSIESETLTLLGKEGKAFERAILTGETTKGIQIKRGRTRLVKTKTGVRLIEEIEAQGKPLTEKQLKDLTLLRGLDQGKPLSETQFLELQRKSRIQLDLAFVGRKGLTRVQEQAFARGIGVSGSILEVPTPKGKAPKTPFKKTFAPTPKGKPITFEKIQKGVNKRINKVQNQVQKQIEKISPKFDVPTQVEVGVRAALKKGVKQVQVPSARIDLVAPSVRQSQEELLKSLKLQPNILDAKNLAKTLSLQPSRFSQQVKQSQSQFQQQAQQLQQGFQTPQTPISQVPTIPLVPALPPAPIGFGRGVDAFLKQMSQSLKKSSKRQAKFTASLSSVFFQKDPIAISKKQLKKLSEKEFTGFETRPVVVLKKAKRKKKKKK